MEVKLLYNAPIELAVRGIRKCYESQDKSDSFYFEDYNGKTEYVLGDKDKALVKRIIESGHESTLEHVTYTFDINGFSRDVLQEFSRHRVGVSPSVKSTRYTLKELKEEKPFHFIFTRGLENELIKERASKYLVYTGDGEVDACSIKALENLRYLVSKGVPNDRAKYAAPGAYKTSGQYTFNTRSLRHLFYWRDSDRALWEFQDLAKLLYLALPKDHLFMYEDVTREETRNARKG